MLFSDFRRGREKKVANSFVHVHLVALRYFSETVRSGSMRQAGEVLAVSASAINRQIMKLEDQLQCRLFERRAEGVRLTAAGEVLYQYVRRLDRELERAIGQIDDLRGLRRGHVHIACEAGIGRDFLPAVLADFHASHPGVTYKVEIKSALEILEQVATDEIDIGIAMSPPTRPEAAIGGRALMPLGVIAAPGWPLAAKSSLRLQDLGGERYIRAKDGMGGGYGWQKIIDQGAPQAAILETNSPDIMSVMVKAGLGIGIRSPIGIMSDLSRGELSFVPLDDSLAPHPSLTLFVRGGRILSSGGAVMLEMLREALPAFSQRVWDLAGAQMPLGGISTGAS
ncbi:transcriptional regulator LysR family protein [Ketogulonicigenium vulgare Y25]|uniref:LysR family protein n=1 Tax=Ketogulonicigenium vulgare (strain WSH-001) TaxID=759362 RepID=F9Y754_KETVW|nr:transcriptional regulator LysR family protein [Ketogulonicigenium vulgare Y25]AEM42244.1 LysR family protein [Ketogulonicigenium vulgare WSH-001]ALJ82195.1 LysR family transcriptional regulator [Ketogulonicigenium vulgare]ANW34826.1 LysR family transcriptional regulator [Ketogulonicigenium vulgare]AOZ53077.1 transcriptional regulator LysR family protein [Ketogulonicigenium vulgare]